MLIYSRNSDPRTGVVEYKLTSINRRKGGGTGNASGRPVARDYPKAVVAAAV